MKRNRPLLLPGGILAVLGLLLFGFLPRSIPVESAQVTSGDLLITVDEEGRTRVRDRYTIHAPVSGYLSRIPLRPGDTVEQENRIAELRPNHPPLLDARTRAGAETAVEVALARRQQAEAQLRAELSQKEIADQAAARARDLKQGSHISQEQLDIAESRARAAAASVESAEFALRAADYEVARARTALIDTDDSSSSLPIAVPISGRILRIHRESEGPVLAGDPLMEVGDPTSLEVVVDLLSSEAVRVEAGNKALLERWGGPPLHARVRWVEPSGFTRISALGVEEQRVPVLIDFEEPPPASLADGFRVEVRIITRSRESVRRIPVSALFETAEGPATFVIHNGRARKQPVSLGERTDRDAEVLDGVEIGNAVIVYPADRITEGARVHVRDRVP